MGGSGARLTRVSWVPGAQAWRAEGPLVTFLWEPSNREPTPLEDQLGENAQPIHPEEAAHGEKRLAQLACAIRSLEPTPATLLALAAPGLRDPDSGGLQAVRNGPRQPFLVRDLAARLDQNETYLFGDSLAGAAGELYGLGGALFGSTNGFYLAGGTGLAEALILGGEVCELTPPWEKALQVFENGVNLEDLLAPYRLKRTPSALDSNGELRIEVLLSRLESYLTLSS